MGGPEGRGAGRGLRTGDPVAPSCNRTFTMSTGWMTQVASIPLAPPLTNGLIAFHMLFFGAVSAVATFALAASSPAIATHSLRCYACTPAGKEH